MKRISTIIAAAAIAAGALTAPAAGAATLTPQQVAGETTLSEVSDLQVTPEVEATKWFQKYKDDARVLKLQATSPAMNGRVVPLAVIRAKDANRPTIYLLNGAGSAEQDSDWLNLSQAVDFYSQKTSTSSFRRPALSPTTPTGSRSRTAATSQARRSGRPS